MVTMLVDHIGYVFFPDQIIFRIIGRVALPLYTFGIAQGYKYTRSFKKYIIRLFIIACVSQIPYMFLFLTKELNIIFTFITSLLLLKFMDTVKGGPLVKILIAIAGSICLQVNGFEYGAYAFLLLLVYHYQHSMLFRHNVLNFAYVLVKSNIVYLIQFFSIIPTLLIKYTRNIRLTGKARYFYLVFYPLHITILLLIYMFLLNQ